MAGESPDRSERERSSGETTEDTGSVPAARRQDPRESRAADAASVDDASDDPSDGTPPGGGSGAGQVSGAEAEGEAGDARLRAAVAAWVSRTEAEDDEPADGAEPDAAGPAGPVEREGTDTDAATDTDASGTAGGAGTGASSDLPVRPRGAAAPSAGDTPATTDSPTTMFGVRPDGDETTDKESAASRAERMTAAFFGSRRPESSGRASGTGDAEDTDAAAAGESAEVPAGAADGGMRPDSGDREPRVTPAEDVRASGEDASGAEAAAPHRTEGETADLVASGGAVTAADEDDSASGGEAGSGEEDAARGSDSGADDEAADGAGRVPGAGAGDGAGAPTGSARRRGGTDRATAVFRAVAPEAVASGTASAAAEASPDEAREDAGPKDQPTTAIRAPEGRANDAAKAAEDDAPQAPEKEDDAARAPEKDSDADRGDSRFVPLRDADAPRAPAVPEGLRQPLPDAETTGNETPASVITGVGGEQERTKQEPVPDPPPLELLAELTNRPAPPETPLRTAVRRVKIWTPLVVLLALVFTVVQAVRPLPEPTPVLTAGATHTFEGGEPSLPWPGEGQAHVEVSGLGVLGSHGEQRSVPIGSVAKTMTAYLVLRKNPLKVGEDGPVIRVDKKAEKEGNRGAGNGDESVLPSVEAGDEISERDALSALMIPSANNIARLLARWHSGSEAAFVEEMNETAEELGMEHTTYTDPSGLKESTVSTAADQVALGKKAMEIPALVAITKQPHWKDPFSGDRMRNWNQLVPFNGAIGIKTGTTTAAGGNLLFAGHKEVGGTRQLIVGAVLGQHKAPIIDTVNAVSRELLDASGETLTAETVVKKGDVVGHVDDGLGGRTPVVATEDVQAVGWGGVEVGLALEPAEEMPHSAPAGERVGVLTVGGGPGRVEVPVALQKELTEPGFGDKLTRIL